MSNFIFVINKLIYYLFILTERFHEIVEILAAVQLVSLSKEVRHDDRSNLSGLEHVTKEYRSERTISCDYAKK